MKPTLRAVFLSLLVSASLIASGPALAESRGKTLKRAMREIYAGNFDKAEAAYRELLARNPEDTDARLGLSLALLKQTRLLESYEAASQVIAADQTNGRAYGLIGAALLRSGEFRNSAQALRAALQINGRDALALAAYAELAFFTHQSRLAYDLLRRAVKIDSRDPDNYIALARACSRMEYYGEAADAYQKFLEVAPKTDEERRARILGLINFYRYLGTTKLHRQAGPEVVTIPFELRGNRPFIKVMINGKGPLKFVVDTGASLSVLSDKAAGRLGIYPVARGGNARAVGGSGSFGIVYGVLDSLAMGEARVDLVPVYIRTVHHSDEMPEEDRADGYLGLSVLANYAVTIDYKARTMTLDRTALRDDAGTQPGGAATLAQSLADAPAPAEAAPVADENGEITIPLRSTSGGLASAEGWLENTRLPLNFIIDTGASATVISKAAVKRHTLDALKLKNARFRVIGAAGIEEGVEALGLNTLTVSGLRQRNGRALILNLEPVNETSGFEQHGILGGDFLRHFKVLLDLRRFQFRLTPQSAGIERIVSN
jgi:tetratricopeptide (TPR) repeat protein